MSDIYREEILEHYKDPQNFGRLSDFTASSKQTNPFCGDEIEIFVKFGEKWKIKVVGFVGKGCAISIAAVSILTEFSKGKSKEELTMFSEKDMLNLLGVKVSETRKKCALLGFSVLKDCLNS